VALRKALPKTAKLSEKLSNTQNDKMKKNERLIKGENNI
jgi:hypothetical protein